MDGASSTTNQKKYRKVEYKSPHHAQVWFLRRSRDLWKQKYMQLKGDKRQLDHKHRNATKSRDSWKAKAKQAESRSSEQEREIASLKLELEQLKKK